MHEQDNFDPQLCRVIAEDESWTVYQHQHDGHLIAYRAGSDEMHVTVCRETNELRIETPNKVSLGDVSVGRYIPLWVLEMLLEKQEVLYPETED